MAVTIATEPLAITPSANPITFTWSSNQTGQANFSYIVETYVGGAKVREEKIFPESSAYAHIDISETVDALISSPVIGSTLVGESNTTVDVYIKVYENYGTPPTNQASATSTTITAFKASVSNETFETIDFGTDYKLALWLTNNPTKNFPILRTQTASCSMLSDGSSVSVFFRFYDIDDNLLHSYNVANTFELWQVNITSALLLSTTGISAPNLASTAYFTVQIASSELITFTYLDDYCYTPQSLLWMNEYGAFDTFIFEHNDIRMGTTESYSYRSQFGKWNGTSFEYNSLNSGHIDYSKTKQDGGKLVSGYMLQSVHDWLVELYNSPFYVTYDIDGTPRAIYITGSSYSYTQERFEDLIMEEIEYKLSNNQKSVRR